MYLEHFKLKEPPFSITPNTDYYCELPGHQEALNVMQFSLHHGEGFIKIVGEVGTGKTLLCRLLLDKLETTFVTTYLPNPALNPEHFLHAFALELNITLDGKEFPPDIHKRIYQKLIELHQQNKRVVLVVDEAQTMPDESLEMLRLLTNLETATSKLLQVVLLGQPELDRKLDAKHLRQLKQRITFSYTLKPLNLQEMEAYLCHRFTKAGFTLGHPFNAKALKLLHQKSKGLPRLVNILAHKALMSSYGRGLTIIDTEAVHAAIADTESTKTRHSTLKRILEMLSSFVLIILPIIILFYGQGGAKHP